MATISHELLSDLPIFRGLSSDELDMVSQLLRSVRFTAGEVVALQGEVTSTMYIIAEGTCQVSMNIEEDDAPYVLAELEAGECIGEMALVEIQPRSATISAMTDVSLLSLTNADFLTLYEENLHTYSMILLNVSRDISRRLRRANGVIVKCTKAIRENCKS
jgi:CRP/FNR family cyclic AMP-dependent transcriptional regulator